MTELRPLSDFDDLAPVNLDLEPFVLPELVDVDLELPEIEPGTKG